MTLVESFSGIRGIYGDSLNNSIAIKYAYAYLEFLKRKTGKNAPAIAIGRDTRPSGESIRNAIMEILDCDIINLDEASTPLIQFAVRHFEADGGIIITASHNEPYWNGLKFLRNDGALINPNDAGRVIKNFRIGNLKDFHKIHERRVFHRQRHAIDGYVSFLKGIIGHKGMQKIGDYSPKIILDPNGGAGRIAESIFRQAGATAFSVNNEPGQFARPVDTTGESLIYLKNLIEEHNADLAAGFDCDADRVGILLKDGALLSGDCVLALAIRSILSEKRKKGCCVVVNDATSNLIHEVAAGFGAKVRETEVGEINVVDEMIRLKAVVGGEGPSGGAIIPPSRCRDGILTLMLILREMSAKKCSIEELVGELPKYYTKNEKINFDPSRHNMIKNRIKKHYLAKGLEIRETGGVSGGLKVITGRKSFTWFRASKTEGSVFRIIADSDKEEHAQSLMDEAVKVFREI